MVATFVTLTDYKMETVEETISVLNETELMFASEVESIGKLKDREHRTIQIEYEPQNAEAVGRLVAAIMKRPDEAEEPCYVCGHGKEEFGVNSYICPTCQQTALLMIQSKRRSQ